MFRKISAFVISATLIAFVVPSAIGAKFKSPLPELIANPSLQIENQISTVNAQIGLIQTSLSVLPRNAVQGPVVSQDIDTAIAPVVDTLDELGKAVHGNLLLDLKKYEGQYKNAAFPNTLTEDYLTQLPQAHGNQEFQCLAEALYFEARGESLQGQRAVAEVILNRVASKRYPNTICGVVNQGTGKKHRCQFSYTCDGNPEIVREPKAYIRGAKIARLMIDGLHETSAITDGALFYHTTGVNPSWARSMKRTAKLGVHLFYR